MEEIEVWAKESLWLLLDKQSKQEKLWETESEIGKENLDKIDSRIWVMGWPSLECQSEKEVLTVGVAKNEAAEVFCDKNLKELSYRTFLFI